MRGWPSCIQSAHSLNHSGLHKTQYTQAVLGKVPVVGLEPTRRFCPLNYSQCSYLGHI